MKTDIVLLFFSLMHFGASFPKNPSVIKFVEHEYSNNYPAFQGNMAGDKFGKRQMDIQLLTILDRTLYIGARNFVYSVNLDESHTDEIYFTKRTEWKPSEAAENKCKIYGKDKEECDNFIKVLLKRNDKTLFICGTNAFNPSCGHYQVDSLELEGDYINGIGRCPYDRKDGNIALFAGDNLYSATVRDMRGVDPIIYRSLGDLPQLRTLKDDSRWLKEPHFVHGVEYGAYIYFFFQELSIEYNGLEKVNISRVARVCKNDMGGNAAFLEKEWTSFLKARLVCTFPGDPPFFFNELQAVTDIVKFKGRDVVFAIFTTPKNSIPGSACCAFALDDIEKAFTGKFKQQRTPTSLWTKVPDDEVPTPRPGSCAGSGSFGEYSSSNDLPTGTLEFSRTNTLMDEVVEPISQQPFHLYIPRNPNYVLSTIAVDTAAGPNGDHTVAFFGLGYGVISKVLYREEGNLVLERMFVYNPTIFIGAKVCNHNIHVCLEAHSTEFNGFNIRCHYAFVLKHNIVDMKLDKPNHVLYVSFSDCVIKVPLGGCERHGPCKKACIGSRDPYCGWANEACIHLSPGTSVEYEQDIEHGNTKGLEDC